MRTVKSWHGCGNIGEEADYGLLSSNEMRRPPGAGIEGESESEEER
jgi:hypothetical protein